MTQQSRCSVAFREKRGRDSKDLPIETGWAERRVMLHFDAPEEETNMKITRTKLAAVLILAITAAPGAGAQSKAKPDTKKQPEVMLKVIKIQHTSEGNKHTYTVFAESSSVKYRLVCRDVGDDIRSTSDKPCPELSVGRTYNVIKERLELFNVACFQFPELEAIAPGLGDYACYRVMDAELKPQNGKQ